jgi:hypothetical protein
MRLRQSGNAEVIFGGEDTNYLRLRGVFVVFDGSSVYVELGGGRTLQVNLEPAGDEPRELEGGEIQALFTWARALTEEEAVAEAEAGEAEGYCRVTGKTADPEGHDVCWKCGGVEGGLIGVGHPKGPRFWCRTCWDIKAAA